MNSQRHCVVSQRRPQPGNTSIVWVEEITAKGVVIQFGLDGRGVRADTKQAEMPEAVGLHLERVAPNNFSVEWREGPLPTPQPLRLPRQTVRRRLEAPTIAELLEDGIAERDAIELRALQLAMYHESVWPYGAKAKPDDPERFEHLFRRQLAKVRDALAPPNAITAPEGGGQPSQSEAVVQRRDDATTGDEAAASAEAVVEQFVAVEQLVAVEPKPQSHYDKRLAALNQMGPEELRLICQEIHATSSNSKRRMVQAILAVEFPQVD